MISHINFFFSKEALSFNSLLSHRHSSRFQFFFELNMLSFNAHLNSQDSC